MLRLKLYENDNTSGPADLEAAYVVGQDRVPMRGEVRVADGEMTIETRARSAAAVAVPWKVPGVGTVVLETPRLPERQEPYNLHVELARGQMMRISQKREDWGFYDFEAGVEHYAKISEARAQLIEAMTAGPGPAAARLANDAIRRGVVAGDELSLFHANVFLDRRIAAGNVAKRPLGCRIDPEQTQNGCADRLAQVFDYGVLPIGQLDNDPSGKAVRDPNIEAWLNHLRQKKKTVWAEGLLTLDPNAMPSWLARAAQDYPKFRDAAQLHIRSMLKAYGPYVHTWEAIRGVHAHNDYRFTFEQIMELTRIACLLVKQTSPKSTVVIGVTQPWGEYYANDPRTIPPMLFAEMALSSGIHFDAFAVDLRFDITSGNPQMRDLMQVSSMLDRFGAFGKPVHVMFAGVPSEQAGDGTSWRDGWSEATQAQWCNDLMRIAFSKPAVESVAFQRLIDRDVPDGLFKKDGSPKAAVMEIMRLRKELGV